MLAKLTSKNQLTLPKRIVAQFPDAAYLDVRTEFGKIVLEPVRPRQAEAVRNKLAELGITVENLKDALTWARRHKDDSGRSVIIVQEAGEMSRICISPTS